MAFPLGSAASAVLAAASGESWEDRVQEGAYHSPSGTRIAFAYENVSRKTPKRVRAFEYAGVNEAYLQPNGHGSRQYPMRCYFTGPNCDRLATAFEAALLEDGIGLLEHPLYGTFPVMPFGTIERDDRLKEAANQSIVEVTFWTTLPAVYPSAEGAPESEIAIALESFDLAAAQQFVDGAALDGLQKAQLKASLRTVLRSVEDTLGEVSATVSEANREFRDLQDEINFGMDVLVGQPLLLAQQMIDLIMAPSRAVDGLVSRLEGYRAFAEQLISTFLPSPSDTASAATLRQRATNEFLLADLSVMSSVSGSVRSAVATQYRTRPEALEAAESVLSAFEEAVAWREQRFQDLELLDTGAAYQALQQAVALVVGHLVRVSFDLVPERSVVLTRPRTVIDLCAELYGSVDDRLDFMIDSNGLTGSEILELPAGRRIVYYTAEAAA